MKKAIIIEVKFTERVIVECDEDSHIIYQSNAIKEISERIQEKINDGSIGDYVDAWYDDNKNPYNPDID